MRKIIIPISVLVMFMFLVSCAPQQISDEELEAELAKLTPEQREALLKDVENKEKNPLSGQAINVKYGVSSKVKLASSKQIQAVMKKLMTAVFPCTDSDGGLNYNLKGEIEGYYFNSTDDNPDLVSFHDSCYDYDAGNHYKEIDECAPTGDDLCHLTEYVCETLVVQYGIEKYLGTTQKEPDGTDIDCLYGCKNGACICPQGGCVSVAQANPNQPQIIQN